MIKGDSYQKVKRPNELQIKLKSFNAKKRNS